MKLCWLRGHKWRFDNLAWMRCQRCHAQKPSVIISGLLNAIVPNPEPWPEHLPKYLGASGGFALWDDGSVYDPFTGLGTYNTPGMKNEVEKRLREGP